MKKCLKNSDTMFFDMAIRAALDSKYSGTKVGAILVKDGHPAAIGLNGFAAKTDDDAINALPRDRRLLLSIHAEENMLLNAAKNGCNANGSRVYVTHIPCVSCLSKMVNAGVKEVYTIENPKFEASWVEPFQDLYSLIPLSKGIRVFSTDELHEAGSVMYSTYEESFK